MEEHQIGLYPMYLIERILERVNSKTEDLIDYEKRRVELCHNKQINIGDTIQYKTKLDLTFKVIEVIEERKAKGTHESDSVKWYNLILEYKK